MEIELFLRIMKILHYYARISTLHNWVLFLMITSLKYFIILSIRFC